MIRRPQQVADLGRGQAGAVSSRQLLPNILQKIVVPFQANRPGKFLLSGVDEINARRRAHSHDCVLAGINPFSE